MKIFPGDIIVTNYNTGPYEVVSITETDDGLSFVCKNMEGKGGFYLNGYEYIDGRCVSPWRLNTKTFEFERMEDFDIDKLDEILIVQPKEQMELFV